MNTAAEQQTMKPKVGRNFLGLTSLRIKFLQMVTRVNPKQIMFMADDGQSFGDSPRTAFELLQADPAYKDFTFIWAFNDPSEFNESAITNKVSTRSFGYLRQLLRSKYWVTNTSIDRYLAFKHPDNVYIQLGAGVPMAYIGADNIEASKAEVKWARTVRFDYLFTDSAFDTAIMRDLFPQADRYNEVGQLRKAALATVHTKLNKSLEMSKLHLNPNKQTILYVATERPTELQSGQMAYLGHEALAELAKNFNVLYRGAGVKEAVLAVPDVINANKLDMNEAFVLSDMMVTDYASEVFDYVVEQKPLYLYQPDAVEFAEEKGVYVTGEELGLPVVRTEKELLHALMSKQPANLSAVEDVLTYYNPLPAQKAVDFLFEIIPAND